MIQPITVERAYLLIKLAREEDRVILTRNTKLFPKRPEDRIVQVMEVKPSLQLRELLQKKVISLKERAPFPDAFSVTFLSTKFHGTRPKGKSRIISFINRKHFPGVPSV